MWYDFVKKYFNEFIVTGNEYLLDSKDRQKIYIANHQSHMDYAIGWLNFHKQGIRMPMIPAGINLDQDFFKKRNIQ